MYFETKGSAETFSLHIAVIQLEFAKEKFYLGLGKIVHHTALSLDPEFELNFHSAFALFSQRNHLRFYVLAIDKLRK